VPDFKVPDPLRPGEVLLLPPLDTPPSNHALLLSSYET
jgi:hypothetical protein